LETSIEKQKKFDALLNKILKCDSKETIDEATVEFLQNPIFIQYKYRRAVLKCLLRSSKNNLALLRYFARLMSNLSPFYKDMPTETSQLLMEDFNDLNKEEKLGMLEEKIKNIRFISEMVKFESFPIQNIFEILKRLIDDFKGHSIDLLCHLIESCGRYLYLNEISHLKFNNFLENLKQLAQTKLRHDERCFNSILNSIQVCKPQDSLLKKQVKIRPVEEEYIRFLFFHLLNKESIKKVAVLIRRMEFDKWEKTIFRVVYKFLNRGNECQIKYACAVLSLLKDFHPNLIYNLVNTVLEEIRIGIERNDFNDNQHKVLMCMLISHFYSYKLITSDIVFYTLYMILTYNPEWNYGRREFITDNPLDTPTDSFRIQMIITVLDICGSILNNGPKKEKLNEFLHLMQIYVLTKQFLPLDVENRIVMCLENLFSADYQVYTDFTEALKDSKKYKGFDFDVENLQTDDTNKIESKNEFSRNVLVRPGEDPEFKRKKEGSQTNVNIDDEIQKIIAESLIKAKSTSKTNTIINPLSDIKKKELNSGNPTKLKLITKQLNTNKVVIKELDKNVFSINEK
jgi:regulator of nonsense transcripts 2